jgi:hypothetical protein
MVTAVAGCSYPDAWSAVSSTVPAVYGHAMRLLLVPVVFVFFRSADWAHKQTHGWMDSVSARRLAHTLVYTLHASTTVVTSLHYDNIFSRTIHFRSAVTFFLLDTTYCCRYPTRIASLSFLFILVPTNLS